MEARKAAMVLKPNAKPNAKSNAKTQTTRVYTPKAKAKGPPPTDLVIRKCIENSELGSVSKDNAYSYINLISVVYRTGGGDVSKKASASKLRGRQNEPCSVAKCLRNYDEVIEAVRARNHTTMSFNQFLVQIRVLFKHCVALKECLGDATLQRYYEIGREYSVMVRDLSNASMPTEKQFGGIMPYVDLVRARDASEHGSMKRLLLFMFVPDLDAPRGPCRQDLGSLSIEFVARARSKNTNKNTNTNVPVDVGGNKIVIEGKRVRLVLNEYKTSKTYGTVCIDLEERTAREVRMHVASNPRTYLFENRFGRPFSDNAFGKWSNKVIQDATGNSRINVQTLRHLYITCRDFKTYGERVDIARTMCHNAAMGMQYEWNIDKNDYKRALIERRGGA